MELRSGGEGQAGGDRVGVLYVYPKASGYQLSVHNSDRRLYHGSDPSLFVYVPVSPSGPCPQSSTTLTAPNAGSVSLVNSTPLILVALSPGQTILTFHCGYFRAKCTEIWLSAALLLPYQKPPDTSSFCASFAIDPAPEETKMILGKEERSSKGVSRSVSTPVDITLVLKIWSPF